MIEESVKKTYKLRCDCCGKVEESEYKKPKGWYVIDVALVQDCLLIEKHTGNAHSFQSFHIPNKEVKSFCSASCFHTEMGRMIKLLAASLKPISKPKGARLLQDMNQAQSSSIQGQIESNS